MNQSGKQGRPSFRVFKFALASLVGLSASSGFPSIPQHAATNNAFAAPDPLPLLIIHTNVQALSKTNRPVTLLSLTDTHAQISQQELVEINGRGSSSFFHPKKCFRLEIQDASGEDKKIPIVGMPKESDWILYASYSDKTFIRNALAHDLWREMGWYAVRFEFVELVASATRYNQEQDSLAFATARLHRESLTNQPATNSLGLPAEVTLPRLGVLSTNEYQGLYLLMEKIKRNKHRLAIEKLDGSESSEPEITGGYIFKQDRVGRREGGFRTLRKLILQFEEPKERDITLPQRSWLTNHINEFEAALFSPDFAHPTTGFRKYIDVESFIDYHWIVEATKNMDGFSISQFYHKDRGGKIKAGPIWDWDISFSNAEYLNGWRIQGWVSETMKGTYSWYARMFEDIDFLQRYVDRWSELRTNIFATSNLFSRIDAYAKRLTNSGAIDRNYKRWPTFGKYVHPNKFIGNNYQEEIGWLKDFIKGRLEWIDSQDFPKPIIQVQSSKSKAESLDTNSISSAISHQPSALIQDSLEFPPLLSTRNQPLPLITNHRLLITSTVQVAWLVGTPYYTLDGTDPRLPGGTVSPKAIRYTEPIQVKPGDKLFLRAKGDPEPAQNAALAKNQQPTTKDQQPTTHNPPCLWSAPQVLSF